MYYKTRNKNISFCFKKATLILDKKLYNTVYNQLYQYRFETKQYIQYNNLTDPKYFLTIFNKNKHNFLLFLLKINNINYNIFIHTNKNNQLDFYLVKFRFSEELYKGTLFNGELVQNNKKCWFYFITDLLYNNQEYTQQYPFSKKLQIISTILKEKYEYDEYMNVCHLKIKSFFLYNNLNFITKDCRLLFIPDNYQNNMYYLDIVVNKKEKKDIAHDTIQKFKILNTNNIDIYELYSNNKFISIACINTLKLSQYFRKEFKDKNEFEINCKYSKYFKSWIPII
jgi:hypothetical protein